MSRKPNIDLINEVRSDERQRVFNALRRVLRDKTDKKLIDAILEDLYDELRPTI